MGLTCRHIPIANTDTHIQRETHREKSIENTYTSHRVQSLKGIPYEENVYQPSWDLICGYIPISYTDTHL